MAPQKQTVNIYDKVENSGSPVKTEHISKTQFLLMAVPTETSSGNKVVPKSINMIPAYGTRADYVSGVNYSARGSVVYKFPPLSYIAKHDNFGTDAELQVQIIRILHIQYATHIVKLKLMKQVYRVIISLQEMNIGEA